MSEKGRKNLRTAVEAIKNGIISLSVASKCFGIARSTLYDHANDISKKFSKGRFPIFNEQEELKFVKMLKSVVDDGYRLTPEACQKAAYLYAEFAGYKHPFNRNKKIAGRKWLSGFMKRNNLKIVTRILYPTSKTKQNKKERKHPFQRKATADKGN